MKHWIRKQLRKALGIDTHDAEIQELMTHLECVEHKLTALQVVHDMLRVDADIAGSVRGPNTIILTGAHRGRAYVRFFDLQAASFDEMVTRMRYYKGLGEARSIDQPESMIQNSGYTWDLNK
jgi:hypothetical protein